MASGDAQLQLIIRAVDEASGTLKAIRSEVEASMGGVQTSLKSVEEESGRMSGILSTLNQNWFAFAAVAGGAGLALSGLIGVMGGSITQADNLQSSLIGLNSVATAFHQDANAATAAAKSLASDGLMTVSDAATGLKNLLATGFSLPQAIQLMNAFKDSAAFNRQSTLSFGDAISSATEGIKNGNDVLSDNAGATENMSTMLKRAGISVTELGNASTNTAVRTAILNGFLRDTAAFSGDAAKLTHTFAGEQQTAAAQTKVLQQQIGTALQSVFLPFLQAITPIIVGLAQWVQNHQKLTAAILIGVGVFLALITVLATVGIAIASIGPIVAMVGAALTVAIFGWIALFALVAAAVIVYWKPISAFFATLWADVMNIFRGNLGVVISILVPFIGIPLEIMAHWDTLRPYFQALVNDISATFRALVPSFGNWGQLAVNAFLAPFLAVPMAVANVLGKIGPVKDALHALHIPGFATGVQDFSGGLALVGEKGPELVELPRGANVFPSGQTQQMLGRGAGGVTVNQTNHIYNKLDWQQATAELGYRLATR